MGQLRARRLAASIREQEAFYSAGSGAAQVRSWQLGRFNELWGEIATHSPYYRSLVEEHGVPRRFSSWEEFSERVPVLDKATLRVQGQALRMHTRPPEFQRVTGGTTAEPVQLPAWRSEEAAREQDVWFARSWFDVGPADRAYLLWGHSHLLGTGLAGRVNAAKRAAKDRLLGYRRYSAYDLSESGLRRAGREMLEFRPAYAVGYSVALERFARVNRDLGPELRGLGLKLVIATGEAFPGGDDAKRVAELMGCAVRMEYGAIETGLVAHQDPAGVYPVFWRRLVVEGRESAQTPGSQEILVTSLEPRCFPLIRYALGDLVSPGPEGDLRRSFGSVTGRCNDWVELPDGMCVHSEAFTHSIRDLSRVRGYQVIQDREGRIAFRYLASDPLPEPDLAEIRRRLTHIHPGLSDVELMRVESLARTQAGKTRSVVRETD